MLVVETSTIRDTLRERIKSTSERVEKIARSGKVSADESRMLEGALANLRKANDSLRMANLESLSKQQALILMQHAMLAFNAAGDLADERLSHAARSRRISTVILACGNLLRALK